MKPIALDAAAVVDTLRFRLAASRTLPHSHVRVGVLVYVLVSVNDRDQDALVARVRAALARFIDASWSVTDIKREADETGYERVELSASAQVPARENHSLDDRARLASVEGLAITLPTVNARLSGTVIAQTTLALHDHILELARQRIERIDHLTGRKWRIGDIQFGIDGEGHDVSPKGVRRETAVFETASDDLLTTCERLLLVAQVTLKSNAA